VDYDDKLPIAKSLYSFTSYIKDLYKGSGWVKGSNDIYIRKVFYLI